MLDDELTLLDGTEVISASAVTKITNGTLQPADLLSRLAPTTILDGIWYFDKAAVAALVAGAR